MMHICFVTNEFPREGFAHGGVGSFVKTISRELTAAGIRVSVVGINYTDEAEEIRDGLFSLYRLPRKSLKGLSWWIRAKALSRKIEAIHKQHPIDIVETPELGLAFLRKIRSVKYIIRLHGGHHFFAEAEKRKVNFWKGFQEKRSFKRADGIIAVSSYVGETTRKLLNLGDINIEVVYNPIHTGNFYPANHGDVIEHKLFFAGSLVEKKGIRQLVQAIDLLIDEFPDVQLLIAGRDGNIPGTGAPYRPVLEEAITERTRKNIVFLGALPHHQLPGLMAKAQICCYPSHMEAMPLAWLEALSMGKIFIGGKAGPGPEIVTDDYNGILADPYSPHDIAEKIRYVFLNYSSLAHWGENARKMIVEKFDVKVITARNIEVYKALLDR